MNLSQAIQEFLEHVEIGKAQSMRTVRNYTHYLKRFEQFAGDLDIEKIDLDLLGKYRLALNRMGDGSGEQLLSRKTQNYHIIALRALLKFLIRKGHDVLAPEKVDLGKAEAREVSFLERDELEGLLESIDTTTPAGLRDRTIIEMLYSTGLRVSEIASLDRDQVSLERGEFMIKGKGRKTRIVFISDRCREWLEKYLASRTDALDPLFINLRGKQTTNALSTKANRLSTVSIEAIVRKYARLSGLVKKVTPHTLRHTFATQLLMNGADIRSVQEMLGHASIATTQVYTHITNAKLREVHRKFHE